MPLVKLTINHVPEEVRQAIALRKVKQGGNATQESIIREILVKELAKEIEELRKL